MVVQHNLTAMNANRYLGINNSKLSKSLEKLSSGYAINRAGDNAAGLAVSEKMRSQIAGMTQGVKNAQDGISMVQTFEGALTETDSILQRMKTLADQAANGTYQDYVDRDAIQLEFDQLNDELNQIADTDFNGVVVLNGGQMADGTVAVDGKFDYSLGRTTTVVANEATDISKEQEHKIVDQTFYDKAKADAVWSAVGADVEKNETLDVTFMYDGERWVSQTVTDGAGKVVEGANAAGLEARAVERNNATGKGGFEVVAGKDPYTGEDIIATNAIFDEYTSSKDVEGKAAPVKQGDTITIRFKNTATSTYAPKNAGIDEDKGETAYTVTPDAGKNLSKTDVAGKIHFKLNDAVVTDEAMDSKMKDILDEIDKTLTFSVHYEDGVPTVTCNGAVKTAFDADTGEIRDANDATIVYGTVTVDKITKASPSQPSSMSISGTGVTASFANDAAKATFEGKIANTDITSADAGTTKIAIEVSNGNTATEKVTFKGMGANGADIEETVDFSSGNAVTIAGNVATALAKYGITCNDAGAGSKLEVTYNAKTSDGAPAAVKDATGTVTFGLNVDSYSVIDLDDIDVHAVETPKVATMASQVAKEGVSKSNAFKNGKAPLTYTDNITLQAGARSKDAVNFTFKYTSGGMGNLKANMNCSAREDGLNTASLSLKTAESANYAIDQIDNAINKVSMVRATFGAVQNRLEHKIDNMNVSIENLTSAESQIRDTDMPTEMMNFTKQQILSQAAQSMLAQANQLPQGVLSLLQ